LDQLRDLFAAVKDQRVLDHLVPLMVWTGMRPGEALALHWEDVDLKAGLVMVRATVAVDEDGRVYRQGFPKGKKPRLVPLVAPAVASLKAVRKAQAAERLEAGQLWADPRLVFTDQLGRLIDDRDLRKRYAPLIKSLGLSGSLQALRRSTATALTAEDVPLGVVSQILGHSSTAITEAHYTIINVAMMQQGLARFQARMEQDG
jgi:integrase